MPAVLCSPYVVGSFEQVPSYLSGLDLVVIFVYIMGNGQDYTLGCDIIQTLVTVSLRHHICLHICKGSFYLYTPVHLELHPLVTLDPGKILLQLFPRSILSYTDIQGNPHIGIRK